LVANMAWVELEKIWKIAFRQQEILGI